MRLLRMTIQSMLLELPGIIQKPGKIQKAFSYDIRLTDLHKIDVVEHIDHNNEYNLFCEQNE